jgi:hypothetical protein
MAEKSRASWQLRRALKKRTRKWRQRQVVVFYCYLFLVPLVFLGEDHHSFRNFFRAVFPFVILWGSGSRWFRAQRGIVRGLDDWAQVSHGLNFDQLAKTEQAEILRKKMLLFGRVVDLGGKVDERQQYLHLHAEDAACRILKTALPWFLAAYWALYLWVPAGGWRDMFMDAPMMMSWLGTFVVTLPTAIEMWTEPDELGEARVI